MSENIDLLKYHYETQIKLDYFILGADIAILGWTIVNTNWLPDKEIYIWLMGGFWILVILSIISGILRQTYISILFGINHQTLQESGLADKIEKSSSQPGARFMDQQTGETISAEEFKKSALPHREQEKKGNVEYKELSNKTAFYSNAATVLLVIALSLLAIIRISIL